jgi:hypothetical protein
MKMSMIQRISPILVGLIISLSLSNDAQAARPGVALTASELAVVDGIQCGRVNSRWIPGKVKNNQLFYSLNSSLKLAIKQLRAAQTTSQKARLIIQIDALKKRIKTGNKTCKVAADLLPATPTALPTISITPAPVSTPVVTATPTVIPPNSVNILWNERATFLRGQNGSTFSYYCPPSGVIGSVYGANIYTDDSSICSAAVHMGLFTVFTGGYATIQIKEGQSIYYGDVRNGVTSSSYGSWSGSFIFVEYPSLAPIVKTPLNPILWSDSVASLASRLGETFDFTCPANGTFASIWGTDIYTADSKVCTAAVHAGRITRIAGGAIRLRIEPGAAIYTGSARNGVTSNSYGLYTASYVFVD